MKNPYSRTKLTCFLATACLALTPGALAVDPPPDGGYPGDNTAEGEDALFNLTTGSDNTAIGFNALFSNTTGSSNTANGWNALSRNTTGYDNTAIGFFALFSNTTGIDNTTIGRSALSSNTTGFYNTATGYAALTSNSVGWLNTGAGFAALYSNTTGSDNTGTGRNVLSKNTTGSYNTATGSAALLRNTTGSSNIALGVLAGSNLTTGSNNIDIGNKGEAGESNTIRIGEGTQRTTIIGGISGATVPTGVPVIVDTNGHLGTTTSSARFKEAIKPMDKASEAILSLQPVTFRYKYELEPDGIPQFGLVAEQVEKVNPDLVARDEQGKPYTVRYEAVNAMLLNEFLKEHRKVEKQEETIAQLKADDTNLKASVALQQNANAEQQKEIQALTAALKEQASRIQKVSDELDLNKSAPRVIAER